MTVSQQHPPQSQSSSSHQVVLSSSSSSTTTTRKKNIHIKSNKNHSPNNNHNDNNNSNSNSSVGSLKTLSSVYRSLLATNGNRVIDTNIHPASSSRCSSAIKCNEHSYCVPVRTIGSLHVKMHHSNNHIHNNDHKKNKHDNHEVMINAHSVSVLDYEYDPFVSTETRGDEDNCQRIVSSGMDNKIKFWSLPQSLFYHGSSDSNRTVVGDADTQHVIQCSSAALRLYFHSMVSGMLITSHQNRHFNIWDLCGNDSEPVWSSMSHSDCVDGVMFSYDGSLMVTASRDRYMRFFDPRVSTQDIWSVNTQMRGLNGVWLGNSPYILNCGFGKSAKREFRIYDTRKMIRDDMMNIGSDVVRDSFLLSYEIDSSPAQLQPFYLQSNNLVMLHGKGDRSIRYFDLDSICNSSSTHRITTNSIYSGEYVANKSQQGIRLMPRKSLDVRRCEVAKFIRLMDSSVDALSFIVPRRNLNLFQEDLYTNEPAKHEAACNFTSWIVDQEPLATSVINFHPEGMQSVYDISVEEGGRIRVVHGDSVSTDSLLEADENEAKIEHHSTKCNSIPISNSNDTTSEMTDATLVSNVIDIINGVEQSSLSQTTIDNNDATVDDVALSLVGETQDEKVISNVSQFNEDVPIVRRKRGGARIINPIKPSSSTPSTISPANQQNNVIGGGVVQTSNTNNPVNTIRLSNYMYKRSPSSLKWKKRWCVFDHDISYFDSPQSQSPIGIITKSSITAISRSNRRDNCIQLTANTGKVTFLAAESKIICEDWMTQLRTLISLSTE